MGFSVCGLLITLNSISNRCKLVGLVLRVALIHIVAGLPFGLPMLQAKLKYTVGGWLRMV
jgi:hypothetical protein